MEKMIFKRAALSTAVVAALVAPGMASAAQDINGPEYAKSYNAFMDEGKLSGGIFYFQRDRQRVEGPLMEDPNDPKKMVPNPNAGKYKSNLSHATAQAALNFNSGYAWDMVGLDLGGFGAYDLSVDETNGVNEENEFSFWKDSWDSKSDGVPENGFSLSNAALKFKFGDKVTAKGGYTQLYVPGVIGVNWSYQPGTYRGGQIEGNFGNLYLTYAIADEYKAPWFKNTSGFSKAGTYDPNRASDENSIDYIHGIAARYTFENGTAVTGSFGQSEGYMDSYHLKLAHKFDVLNGLATSYQFYGSDTENEDYDGLAWQQAFTTAWGQGPYSFRFEGMWTKAEGDDKDALGNYLPRLTKGYGNSNGANEIWWDSRSDWNHNEEKAVFFGVNRSLDDLVGAPGWSVGTSGAYGWDANNAQGSLEGGTEWALNFDVMYTVQDGKLKGTLFKLHYTDYNNEQDEKGSWYYPNMFTSEHDVKFHVVMPFTFL